MTEKRWRTIQFFLMPKGDGVCEVQSDPEGNFRCDCQVFLSKKTCRHTRFVKKKSDSNNGLYPLQVSPRASSKEMAMAQKDLKKFRSFVLKYGKVEVL